jgi:Type IV secretion-system coupling protein DNA-binding domain
LISLVVPRSAAARGHGPSPWLKAIEEVWHQARLTLFRWLGAHPAVGRLLVAAVGALVLLAVTRWWLRARAWRPTGSTYEIRPPAEGTWDPNAWVTFYRILFGISAPWWKRTVLGQPWCSLELWAFAGRIVARCWIPDRLASLLRTQLLLTLPGAEISVVADNDHLPEPAVRSRLVFWREALYPLAQPKTDPLGSVLSALSVAPVGVVQVVASPDVHWQRRAARRLDQLSGAVSSPRLVSSVLWELVDIFFGSILAKPTATGSPAPRSTWPMPPHDKAVQPGYRVEIRLRVSAGTLAGARGFMHGLTSAFRALDGNNGLRPARVWRGSRFDADLIRRNPPRTKGLILTPEELANLFHLPAAGNAMDVAPIRLAPTGQSPGDGKVVCLADDGPRTPVTISQADCRQHIHVLGPTGSGKSTVLFNLALDDIDAGRGVGVIDPKGDLVRELLERIPKSAAPRVILIDPAYRDRPVGLNVLECPEPERREVVCDEIVTIFRKMYAQFWGPRTDDVLRAALLTLLHHPGTTLCEVPLLLLRPEARESLTANLDDPVGLQPFWDEYERMSESRRLQVIGPLLNKLRSVLLRRTVRNMFGQSTSTVSLTHALDHQGIVLVSLAKGLLGEETSRLVGSFLVARIWQAAMARADRPEERRTDFNLYLDEFQNYLHLPQSLDEILVEARGYRLSLTLANQHLGQLSATTREALSANARTRIVFQCGQEDARYLAREFDPGLRERDLRNLQRFQVAVRLCVNGRTQPPFTGLTRPMSEGFGDGHSARLVESALRQYGRPRLQVEADIIERLDSTGLLEAEEDNAT